MNKDWALVPLNPTEEMYTGNDAPTSFAYYLPFRDFAFSYKAMVKAAPEFNNEELVECIFSHIIHYIDTSWVAIEGEIKEAIRQGMKFPLTPLVL